MRDWHLGAGDPLCLTLAADARFCTPDYANDHIWELELGSGEPAALSLRTTYGLRARSMRIFPRFTEGGHSVSEPKAFTVPPYLKRFYSNFLMLHFSPFSGIGINAEYWVPESQVIAGRLTIVNRTTAQRQISLEMCGLLVPLEGQNLSPLLMQSVNVLAGRTGGLAPVIFMTGGPQPGLGPYPSLMIDLELGPGATQQLTWVQAALPGVQASFEMARRVAARPWEAERARLELLNASQMVKIQTGNPEWDAGLAFSQQAAFSLFFGASDHLPQPSFVQARQPDHGYSYKGDGSDYPPFWSGQPPLEAYYLASLLPGAPLLARGVLQNFLSVQAEDGFIDCQPGIAGQRGKFLAAPWLASLAWKLYQVSGDDDFLAEVFPNLLSFFWAWLVSGRDRDNNGLPVWDNHRQTSFEDNPLFSYWQPWAQGVDINTVESPALAAALFHEAECLIHMADHIGRTGDSALIQAQVGRLRDKVELRWNPRSALYHYVDRDSHLSLRSKILGRKRGPSTILLKQNFAQPVRLLIEVKGMGKTVPHPEVVISEFITKMGKGEVISKHSFRWRANGAVATSQKVFSRIGKIDVRGIGPKDKVVIRTVGLTHEDHTLFLPLWAGIPDILRAQTLIGKSLLEEKRFDRPFGVPACPSVPDSRAESVCLSVHLPWNHLIGEGLLAYGFRSEAARLVTHLMDAIIQNLKKKKAFYRYYHAENGEGIGERNALGGLAPVGLFLQTLGVTIISSSRIRLEGKNPFPWPITVKYRGLTVIRQTDQTEVIFPNGQSVFVTDAHPCIVSL